MMHHRLTALLQARAGHAVPYSAIIRHLWPRGHPSGDREHALSEVVQLVHLARRELPPGAISTAPGFGYAYTGATGPKPIREIVEPIVARAAAKRKAAA